MESIETAINLLKAVHSTMDTISVVGIENMDKFVGSANAVLTSAQTLEKFVQAETGKREAQVKPTMEVNKVNAEHPDPCLNINTEEETNG